MRIPDTHISIEFSPGELQVLRAAILGFALDKREEAEEVGTSGATSGIAAVAWAMHEALEKAYKYSPEPN